MIREISVFGLQFIFNLGIDPKDQVPNHVDLP